MLGVSELLALYFRLSVCTVQDVVPVMRRPQVANNHLSVLLLMPTLRVWEGKGLHCGMTKTATSTIKAFDLAYIM